MIKIRKELPLGVSIHEYNDFINLAAEMRSPIFQYTTEQNSWLYFIHDQIVYGYNYFGKLQ